jgi:hypothetical protein
VSSRFGARIVVARAHNGAEGLDLNSPGVAPRMESGDWTRDLAVVIKEGDVGVGLGRKMMALMGGVGTSMGESERRRARDAGPAASWARPMAQSKGRSGPREGNGACGSVAAGLRPGLGPRRSARG